MKKIAKRAFIRLIKNLWQSPAKCYEKTDRFVLVLRRERVDYVENIFYDYVLIKKKKTLAKMENQWFD